MPPHPRRPPVLTALGARRSALRAAAARSPHAVDGVFGNAEGGGVVAPTGPLRLARALLTRGPTGRPTRPVPLVTGGTPTAGTGTGGIGVTWFGHSSALLEIDGHRVLTDPVWGDRASPSRLFGPRRLHPPPVPAPPDVDVVLVSHDHYDHLDLPTVRTLLARGTAPFMVPIGVGAHLRAWGVPAGRIVELDWDASTTVGRLTITCTEARHFSGRGPDRNTTQWSSWVVAGPGHRAYFGGDTGYGAAFASIGRRFGPFDVALLPVGAYSDLWPDIHLTPEEAVRAHLELAAGLLVPVHWATFNLGFHGWAEPVQRLRVAAAAAGVRLAVPRPGERVDVAAPPALHDWWSAVG